MDNDAQFFGDVEFDAAKGKLSVAGRPVELDRPCMAILSLLACEADRVVDKDRLLEAGWPGRIVHENSLPKAIGRLRLALGRDGIALMTVHGYGYRLATAVRGETPAGETPRAVVRPRRLGRPAFLFGAVVLAGFAGLVALWQANGAQHVINGEPSDSVGRILWVDDHPENNVAEKRFLEQHKIGVYQVKNTKDALSLLQMYAYGAVVSDMGRDDRPLAGIDLLKAMRARGDERPFFLYTVYSSEAQRRLVAESGGQGVATTREELDTELLPLFGGAE